MTFALALKMSWRTIPGRERGKSFWARKQSEERPGRCPTAKFQNPVISCSDWRGETCEPQSRMKTSPRWSNDGVDHPLGSGGECL